MKKSREWLVVLLVVLFSVTSLFAAGTKENAPAQSESSFLSDSAGLTNGSFLEDVPKPTKQWKLANITRTLMNAHWVKNKEGFEAAGKH